MSDRLPWLLFVCASAFAIAMGATGAEARADWRSDPDIARCNYEKHRDAAPVTNEVVNRWLHGVASFAWQPSTTITGAQDSFAIDLAASKNYLGFAGGGGGSRMLYDPTHRRLAICQVYDTAVGLFLLTRIPPPPFAVPRGDLANVATARGIRIGSSLANVRAVYGPSPLVPFAKGHFAVGYVRDDSAETNPHAPPTFTPFGVNTWFEIANGRVVGIERITGF